MKGFILYSPQGSKKHKESFNAIHEAADKLAVPLYKYAERIQTREDIKWLLSGADDGFADIMKKSPPRSVLSMPYSEAIDWMLDKPNDRFTSLLAVYLNNDNTIFRLDRDLKGVKYFLHCVESIKKE